MINIELKMNEYVADLTVLYTKLHNLHWYITGPKFFEFHELFEEYYDKVTEDLDEIAERMLQLEMKPAGSLKKVLELAKIEEREDAFGKDLDFVAMVKADFEYMMDASITLRKLAEEAEDEPTVDLMIEATAYYQKALWMLKAALA